MKVKIFGITLITALSSNFCMAQVPEVRPQVVDRALQEGQVITVYLAPRFATAIRMPDAINSVVLGDPESFSAEHSDKEPQIVFVKPVTTKAAQTNLLISTARYQADLLLISLGDPVGRGNTARAQLSVDFMMRYRPAGRFIIDPSDLSVGIAQTTTLTTLGEKTAQGPAARQSGERLAAPVVSSVVPVSLPLAGNTTPLNITTANRESAQAHEALSDLDTLLERQKKAPLPVMYGEKPGVAPPGKQLLIAGVSEVIDQGTEVVVLFSTLNVQSHPVQLMAPQVQLAGKRHKVWSNSEQLPVEEFRMSRRRLGPGERADGVVVFKRPSFKQSNETLLLQMADSGAVDRPALAPIGFGISSLRREGGE